MMLGSLSIILESIGKEKIILQLIHKKVNAITSKVESAFSYDNFCNANHFFNKWYERSNF